MIEPVIREEVAISDSGQRKIQLAVVGVARTRPTGWHGDPFPFVVRF